MKVAIIGGGLAGCSLAYALNIEGVEPVVYEAGSSLASGASGNSTGLYNPRFTAQRDAQSDYYAAAFSLALRTFKMLKNIDWNPCGVMHLMNDDKKARRYPQTMKNWGWDSSHMQLLNTVEASNIAGIDLNYDALYLPQSGSISPLKLCEAYMRGVEYHLNTVIDSPDEVEGDVVILACGPAVEKFVPDLPIKRVRGQITEVKTSELSRDMQCAVCYGGYFSAAQNRRHVVGSSFQPWLDHSEIIEQDDQDNIRKLADNIPGLEQGLEIVGSRASVRATSKDHFPIVGRLRDNLYISAAHGSHGILSSLMASQLLTDMVLGRPLCLGRHSVAALSPTRFF